jgi:sugar (pentulose or hexulose) kinase
VRGVVLTTRRGTVINLDERLQPLRPAIAWPDERRTPVQGRLSWHWSAAFALLGLRDTIRTFREQAEANWIARHEPQLWARTHKFVLLSAYLNLRLTGRLVDAVGSQVGYLPFDFRRGRWAAPRDWKWECLPLQASMLPELAPSASVIGTVGGAAAAETGIPAGLPVVAGAADKACEVLGAGCLTPEMACISYGTTATINTNTPRYVEPMPLVPPYPSALPGHYNTELQLPRGYWLASWFARQFAPHECARAAELGCAPEALLEELLAATPAGADGLVLMPTWSPGVRLPGPEARGAVVGWHASHTRAHLYRAIVEGVAYAMREGRERIERRSGTPITALRVAGGGSRSDAAMQLTADILGLPAERPALSEASGLGAAMLASVALGLHPDPATAVRAMARVGSRFVPDPDRRAFHDALYRRVWQPLYPRLRPLLRALRELRQPPRAPT